MPAAPQDWAVVAVTAGEGVVGWAACAGSPPVPRRTVGQPPSPGPLGPQVLASPPAVDGGVVHGPAFTELGLPQCMG